MTDADLMAVVGGSAIVSGDGLDNTLGSMGSANLNVTGSGLGQTTISPPAHSEDLSRVKDPVEAIARSSQIRTRRVVLEHRFSNPGRTSPRQSPLSGNTRVGALAPLRLYG